MRVWDEGLGLRGRGMTVWESRKRSRSSRLEKKREKEKEKETTKKTQAGYLLS